MNSNCVKWNNEVKLIIADVDDTIAEIFENVSIELVYELEELLREGKIIFFISGQGIFNIYNRVISFLNKKFLGQVIVAHCNGSEIYAFDNEGNIIPTPIFSVCDLLPNDIDRNKIKTVVKEVLDYFSLIPFSPMSLNEFKNATNSKSNCVMVDDRSVQISIDFINSLDVRDFELKIDEVSKYNTFDIRHIIRDRATKIINELGLPIEPCLAGTCAIDFNYIGVSKALPIKQIVEFGSNFQNSLPNKIIVSSNSEIEVWGDSFSIHSGSDRNMSLALPKEVRSISFRDLSEKEQDDDYNIVQWNGKYRCNRGTLEYLKERYS